MCQERNTGSKEKPRLFQKILLGTLIFSFGQIPISIFAQNGSRESTAITRGAEKPDSVIPPDRIASALTYKKMRPEAINWSIDHVEFWHVESEGHTGAHFYPNVINPDGLNQDLSNLPKIVGRIQFGTNWPNSETIYHEVVHALDYASRGWPWFFDEAGMKRDMEDLAEQTQYPDAALAAKRVISEYWLTIKQKEEGQHDIWHWYFFLLDQPEIQGDLTKLPPKVIKTHYPYLKARYRTTLLLVQR